MYTITIQYRTVEEGDWTQYHEESDIFYYQLVSFAKKARHLSLIHPESQIKIAYKGEIKYHAVYRLGSVFKQLV